MTRERQRLLVNRLDGLGWGLGFSWIGLALLLEIDLGPALVGLGAVILGVQGLRRSSGLGLEAFWVATGTALLLGGLGRAAGFEFELLPLGLLAFGATLVVAALAGRGKGDDRFTAASGSS